MWETCCSLAESPNVIASCAVAAIGLCLLSKAVDDWQAQRVGQKNRSRAAARTAGRDQPPAEDARPA